MTTHPQKSKENKNDFFVLTLPLRVEPWEADILDKHYEYLRIIYNYVQSKLLRQYRYFEQTNEYKSLHVFKEKKEFFLRHPFYINGIVGRNKELYPITFTELGIKNLIAKLNQKVIGDTTFKDLGINTTNLGGLGRNIWSAWEKFIYGKGKRIKFKRRGELNTLEYSISRSHNKDVFIGLEIDLLNMSIKIKLNGFTGLKAKWMTIFIGNGKEVTNYEKEALNIDFSNIRTITIARKSRNGKWKYYVQLTLRGKHDNKGRSLGKGQVGIDIGPSTIAVSSIHGVRIDKLANGLESIEHDKKIIQHKLERSRRANNPDNYYSNGFMKKGIKRWNESKRYKKLLSQFQELIRHQAAIRRMKHIEMANEILSLGDVFVVENNPIKEWAAKAKETKKNDKTGRYDSKKRFGKSITNHAPAEFITILRNKVVSLGGKFYEVDIKNAATRFDFTINDFTQLHKLSERQITLSNGDTHQRDLMSAFNLQHVSTDENELKKYDVEGMWRDYPIFCKLEREEIEKYQRGEKKDDKSTIDAFNI